MMALRALVGYLACGALLACWCGPAPASVWDTLIPLHEAPPVKDREVWPLLFEAQLAQGYALRGDLVVETGGRMVILSANKGVAEFYVPVDHGWMHRFDLDCFPERDGEAVPRTVTVAQESPEEVIVARVLEGDAGSGAEAVLTCRDGLIEVTRPGEGHAVVVRTPMRYAIVPHLLGDDFIYDAARSGDLGRFHLPMRNVLVGLLEGEEGLLTLCRAETNETAAEVTQSDDGQTRFSAIRVGLGPGGLALGFTDRARCWHAQPAEIAYFEKPMPTGWKRCFPAKWLAQFGYHGFSPKNWRDPAPYAQYEPVMSTFAFSQGESRAWKAMVGWHEWPCWFNEDEAGIQFGKKILPPAPEVLFYFLERNENTPEGCWTPEDVVHAALGDSWADVWPAKDARKARPLNRRGSVFNQPTCGTTEKLEAYFKEGKEVAERDLVHKVADDLAFYYENMERRLDEFRECARTIRRMMRESAEASPELKPFLEEIAPDAALDEMEAARDLFGLASKLRPAAEVLDALKALCETERDTNLGQYIALKAEIRQRGGALDGAAAKADLLLRGILQNVSYRCVTDPARAAFAAALVEAVSPYQDRPTPWEQVR